MLQIERHQKLLDYINNEGNVTTDQMAEFLDVSKPTVRRDVDALSKNGLIRKVHGGAVSVDSSSLREIPYEDKSETFIHEKQRIGYAASRRVHPGDVMILDSGSTALEVAKNLSQPNLTVLTNDIKIAMELSSKENVHTIMCGGTLESSVYTLTGTASVDFFRSVHVNKLFLGCDGADLAFGISDRSAATAAVKQAMIAAADEVIMVADSSKLGRKTIFQVCEMSAVDTIITDRIEEGYAAAVGKMEIEVVLAEDM